MFDFAKLLIATLGPRLLEVGKVLSGAASSFGTIAAAAFAAVPGILVGVAAILKEIAANAVLLVMFCAFVFGGLGVVYGISRDAPARAAYQQAAIRAANLRADAAIAKIKADYERQLAAAKKQAATKRR